MEIAERLFIYGTSYSSFEIKIIITILYAKSLFLTEEYARSFELLQSEYIKNPMFPSFLYIYGKYVIKSWIKNDETGRIKTYFGSTVGALEECLRGCVKERYGKINYYLGKAYQMN